MYSVDCTLGDGGVPYVARDSPAKDFCELTGNGAGVFLVSLAAVIGLGALTSGRGRRWREGESPVTFAGLAILTAIAPLAVLWLANIPSGECTGEKLAAYEAWQDAGRVGEAPYDCEKY